MKLLVLLLVIVVALMVGTALVFQFFGWQGLLFLIVGMIVGLYVLKRLAGWLIMRMFLLPFRKKGAVLEGATVEVHRVTRAEPPDRSDEIADERALLEEAGFDDEYGEEEYESEEYIRDLIAHDAAADWYEIDVTITPATSDTERAQTPFRLWEPAELMLVPSSFDGNRFDAGDAEEIEEHAGLGVHSVQVWRGGAFQEDEEGEYGGTQRLLLHAGVPRGSRDMKFMYYFNSFGRVELPTIDV